MVRPEVRAPLARGRLLIMLLLLAAGPVTAETQFDEVSAAVRARDYARAAKLLTDLAETGDSEAQYRLAGFYRSGRGVERSDAEAVGWIERAARKGHAAAQYSLGLAYQAGRGVAADPAAARRWLQLAAGKGHEPAAKRLALLAPPAIADATDPRARPGPRPDGHALRRAAAAGDLQQVRDLLGAGVGVDAVDDYGRSALIEAVSQGRMAVARLLLEHGADIERKDRYGDNALLIAAVRGADKMLAWLLLRGAQVDARDGDANTALMLAAARGHAPTVRKLLQAGAAPTARNNRGQTALNLAPTTDRRLTALLSQHRDPRAEAEAARDRRGQAQARLQRNQDDQGLYASWPPVMLAAWRRQHELLDAVIARGADVNIHDSEGHSPLTRAVLRADSIAVAKLLAAGARPDLPGVSPSALVRALKTGAPASAAIAEQLLAAGADANTADRTGASALVLAVETGRLALVRRMLAAGAHPESADRAGVTALMHAAHNADLAVVIALLDGGAAVDAVDLQGRRALDHAVDGVGTEVMQRLFAAGARPAVGADGSNLFHRVARSGSGVLIPILLNQGVRPDVPDLQGNTPLMVAAALGQAQVLEVLLALDADLAHRNADGNTALHLAVANSRVDCARLLLERGADPRTRNHNGESAATLAQAVEATELSGLIDEARKGRWFGLF